MRSIFFEQGSFTRSHNPEFQNKNRARVALTIIQCSQPPPNKESKQNQFAAETRNTRDRETSTIPQPSLHLKPRTPQERPEAN